MKALTGGANLLPTTISFHVSVTQTPQTKPIVLDNFQLFGVRHLRELLAII